MLTRVQLLGEHHFYMNIRDAQPTDSIIVEKIEGLNPPDVELFIGDRAGDGGHYSGRRVPPRTVIFTLQMNPNYGLGETVSGVRNKLYKAFMNHTVGDNFLHFVLEDDEVPNRTFFGYTEKFEPDIFSNDNVVSITVLCPDPYLNDSDLTTITLDAASGPVSYTGSAPTGVVVKATILSTTSTITIDMNDGQYLYLDYPFVAGDQILINTRRGERKVFLTRGGVETRILYALRPGSKWLEIVSEENLFTIYGASSAENIAEINQVRYIGASWGI